MLSVVDFPWPVGPCKLVRGASTTRVGDSLYIVQEQGLRAGYPLRKTGLFRQFAETATTPDGILQFATENGLLGGPIGDHILVPHATALGGEGVLHGEAVERWREEIQLLRTAVAVWDGRRKPPQTARRAMNLDRIAEYHSTDFLKLPTWPPPGLTMEQREEGMNQDVELGDWQSILRAAVNRSIEHQVSCVVAPDPKSEGSILLLRPAHLRAAIWLQFATAISYRLEYRRCLVCDDWFEVSNRQEGGRTNRKYCNDACKARAYRRRKVKLTVRP